MMKKTYVVLFFFAIGLLASTAVMADTLSECPVSKMLLKCPDMTMPDDSKRITAYDFVDTVIKIAANNGINRKVTNCQKVDENLYRIDTNSKDPATGADDPETYGFRVTNNHAVFVYSKADRALNSNELELACLIIIKNVSK